MSESFDFGAMVSAQMKPFKQSFKFPTTFNELKSVDPVAAKKALAAGTLANEEEAADAEGAAAAKPTVDVSLKSAFETQTPVEGKVEKEIKGGYEVTVKGKRAFCPFSQIDRIRKPGTVYVGETFLFQISEYGVDDRGENLVVSRRAELALEAQALKEDLRATLTEGQTVNGFVTKVLEFGAFVDVGGMEGLVPVREISWDRVIHPQDFVRPGDSVTVKIVSLDWERERISLSIRECQAKPLKKMTPEEEAAAAEQVDIRAAIEKTNAESAAFGLGAFDGLKV